MLWMRELQQQQQQQQQPGACAHAPGSTIAQPIRRFYRAILNQHTGI